METVLLVIHMILALAIIGLVLIQRSEGGGLGIGGGGGGLGNFATPRSTANALTRATALCVAGFFATSLILGIMAGTHTRSKGILDTYGIKTETPAVPNGTAAPVAPTSSTETPAAPQDKTAPSSAPKTATPAQGTPPQASTPEKTRAPAAPVSE